MSTFWEKAGDFLGGVGGFFGGISGDSGGAARRQTERWNKQAQENWERTFSSSVQARVRDAQAAGISPLSALGISGTSLPSFSPGTYGGKGPRNYSAAAQGLSRAMAARQASKDRAEIRQRDAEAHKSRMEAEEAYTNAQVNMGKLSALQQQMVKRQILDQIRKARDPVGALQGIYEGRYDNRDEIKAQYGEKYGDKLQIFLDPRLAEAIQGLAPILYSLGGNVDISQQERLGREQVGKGLQGEPGWIPLPETN